MTALDGGPVDYTAACRDPGRRYTWCVAPPRTHAELLSIVARHPRVTR